MAAVTRLLTYVDINDEDDDGPDARRMSVSARHEAVLAGGRRVVLLADRGWSGEVVGAWHDEPFEQNRRNLELSAIWASETVEGMKREARVVVGPTSRSRVGRRPTWNQTTGTHWRESSNSTVSRSKPPN